MSKEGRKLEVGEPGSYDIVVEPGAVGELATLLSDSIHRVAVVADQNVARLYGEVVCSVVEGCGRQCRVFEFPPGEHNKSRQTKAALEDAMLDGGFGRDTLVVGLGGGVSTDLAGFVAATYMRGVELVNIPTSLLAMVDATVGGKTGINAAGGKNLIGAFHQPRGVIADTSLLATLPEGEWENGLAEMIKHGVIEQRDHLERIAAVAPSIRAADPGVVAEVVAESVAIKVRVVCDDPFEEGRRKVLNFGHTVGHGLEKLSGYRLSHGKAVSVGMVFESEIAVELGVLDQADRDIIVDALEHAGLPTGGMEIDGGRLIEAMGLDKKKKRGKTMMALPCAIGKMVQNHGNWAVEVDSQTILGVARKLA